MFNKIDTPVLGRSSKVNSEGRISWEPGVDSRLNTQCHEYKFTNQNALRTVAFDDAGMVQSQIIGGSLAES